MQLTAAIRLTLFTFMFWIVDKLRSNMSQKNQEAQKNINLVVSNRLYESLISMNAIIKKNTQVLFAESPLRIMCKIKFLRIFRLFFTFTNIQRWYYNNMSLKHKHPLKYFDIVILRFGKPFNVTIDIFHEIQTLFSHMLSPSVLKLFEKT